MAEISLKSNDNQVHKLPAGACKKSNFLKSQIDSGKSEIVLDDIKGDILKLVADYLIHYENTAFPKLPEVLKSNDLKGQLENWDAEFIDQVSYEVAFHLINAGVLLELEHLHDLACSKIAAFMKGKSPEEVNKEFTIECQLTQEEAKELGLDTQE